MTTSIQNSLTYFLVVIGGFTGASVLIYTSFQSWADSPVKTTIETLPITKITFPKVTVCPPKNTFTDLNYDLMMTKNMTLNKDTKNELTNYALEMLHEHLHDNMIENMRKLEEKDRYYNWYHGYERVMPDIAILDGEVTYELETAATSGTITTQYYGDKFDANKVEVQLYYKVKVTPPGSVRNNRNVTLHFEMEKLSLKDTRNGGDYYPYWMGGKDVETTHGSVNYTPPASSYQKRRDISLRRIHVLPEDVRKQKLDLMPGFRFTWHYSGMEVKPEASYYNQAFVRYDSIQNSGDLTSLPFLRFL